MAVKLDPADFMFKKRVNEDLTKLPGTINGNGFVIDSCVGCNIFIMDHTSQVQIDDCVDCKILIGPCNGSVFIRDCTGCQVAVAARQLRTRDCKDVTLSVYCATQPSIETSTGITFSEWQGSYPMLESHFVSAKMDASSNSWEQVYDFNAGEEPGVQHFQVSHTSPFSAGFWDVDSRGSSSGQPATTKTVNPPSFSPSTQSAADDIPLTSQSDLALDTQSPVLEASEFQDPDSLSLVRIDLAPAQGPDSLHMGSGGFQDPQGSHPIQPSVTAFVVGEVQSPVKGKLQHGMDGDFDFFSGMQSASSAVVVEAFAEDLFSDFAVPAVTEQQPLPVVISTDADLSSTCGPTVSSPRNPNGKTWDDEIELEDEDMEEGGGILDDSAVDPTLADGSYSFPMSAEHHVAPPSNTGTLSAAATQAVDTWQLEAMSLPGAGSAGSGETVGAGSSDAALLEASDVAAAQIAEKEASAAASHQAAVAAAAAEVAQEEAKAAVAEQTAAKMAAAEEAAAAAAAERAAAQEAAAKAAVEEAAAAKVAAEEVAAKEEAAEMAAFKAATAQLAAAKEAAAAQEAATAAQEASAIALLEEMAAEAATTAAGVEAAASAARAAAEAAAVAEGMRAVAATAAVAAAAAQPDKIQVVGEVGWDAANQARMRAVDLQEQASKAALRQAAALTIANMHQVRALALKTHKVVQRAPAHQEATASVGWARVAQLVSDAKTRADTKRLKQLLTVLSQRRA